MQIHPNFVPLSLLQSSQRIKLISGQGLFSQGETVNYLHWILDGEVHALRTSPSGRKAIMMRGHAGEFFAEAALFTTTYTCDAVATKPTVLIGFPISNLRRTLQTEVAFSTAFLRTIVIGLRRQCSRVERLRLRGASERIEHFLSCEVGPDGWTELDHPLSEWALDMGLEPETLYRTLRTLEHNGKVQREGRRLRLLTLK